MKVRICVHSQENYHALETLELRPSRTFRDYIAWDGGRVRVTPVGKEKGWNYAALFARRVDALRFAKAHGLEVTNWATR